MQFKQYPSYKNSGVEWLGDVPEHWGMNRLGLHFRNRKEKVSDKDFKPLSVTKHGIVPQLEHAAKSDNGDNRKLVRKGDYVINSRSDRKGSSGLADLDGSVSLINIVLTPFKTIHPKFSHYLLRSYLFQEEFYKYGHGIVADLWTTNYEDMRNIHLALPSVSEQTQISNFLEQETTRIDNLIAKQEKLIELLEEQRKSIISHAVTKGLNPNAPMKDSGVEWLGEVPEHWDSASVKYLCKIDTGNKDTVDALEDGIYPFFVRSKKIETINEYAFDGEAILTAGDGAGVGKIYHYINGKFNYHQRVYKMSHFTKVSGKFFFFYFSSLFEKVALDGGAKSTVDSLRKSHFDKFIMAIPTSYEQQEIVEYIEQQANKIDFLIEKQNQLIEKFKEYRSSIISHAVTGKIDVREFGA